MIIEDLIRTGRLLQEGRLSDEKLLELISDVTSPRVRGFFQHVFVVELPASDSEQAPEVLPMQVWGSQIQPDPNKKKTLFEPDYRKALGAPFVFPGGNPIQPQGVYGVPVFPVFERHLETFRQHPDQIARFLEGRLKRCPSLTLTDAMKQAVAQRLFTAIQRDEPQAAGKTMCLIVIVDAFAKEPLYTHRDAPFPGSLGASRVAPGRFIAPVLQRLVAGYAAAKFAEGAEHGAKRGACSFCGQTGDLVSVYCKAWPWFRPTWTCPLPEGGDKRLIIEGVAVDEACYSALNCGAAYFDKVTAPVDAIVTRELFSPVADRAAQRSLEHRSLTDLPVIYGAILLLPILELTRLTDEIREELGDALSVRLNPSRAQGRLQQHVERIVGFETVIPDDVDDAQYRLSLIYYHGDAGRGDIHLRACIEDVLPSALRQLEQQAAGLHDRALPLVRHLLGTRSEKQQAYHLRRFRLIPFLLAKAYGGPYLWDQLQRVLRRQPLDERRPTFNTVRRIASLVRRIPQTEPEIREEVLFYLVFLDFLLQYNRTIARGGAQQMPMRNWSELLEAIGNRSPEEMALDGVGELGFACGCLIRQFSQQYWTVTRVGKEGRDYLQHRVLAFGTELTPDVVWKKALPGVFNLEVKLDKLHLRDDFRRRIGIVLNHCENLQDAIRTERDRFMAAFWSGYALQRSQAKTTPPTIEEDSDD